MNQFSRQSPAQWLNNLAQMKQKGYGGGGGGGGGGPPPPHMGPKCGPGPGGPPPRMMGPSGPLHDLDSIPDGPDMGPNREIHPDFPPITPWMQQVRINNLFY